MLCGKLLENLLIRMKLKTLQTLWKLDYLRFFWNYLDINYVFQSICNLWALCGFNTMPCVISRWSPNLVSVVFVTTESNPGQCPFTLDDAFFPVVHGGKRFLDCVWVRLLSMGPRDHMQERSYLMHSLCCPWGREKPWGYGWGCCPWDQESAYQRGQYHASCEWVDPLTGLCGSVVYLW